MRGEAERGRPGGFLPLLPVPADCMWRRRLQAPCDGRGRGEVYVCLTRAGRRKPCTPGAESGTELCPPRRAPGRLGRVRPGARSLPEAGARRGEPGGEAERAPGRSPAPWCPGNHFWFGVSPAAGLPLLARGGSWLREEVCEGEEVNLPGGGSDELPNR